MNRSVRAVLATLAAALAVAPIAISAPAHADSSSGTTTRTSAMGARLATGSSHTCALFDNGQVTCWGEGTNGRLGYGNVNSIGDDETPAQNSFNGGILQLPGGRPAIAIAAGQTHTCAILDTGQVTCWGSGSGGALGYGNTNTIGDGETPAQNPVNGGIVALPGGQTAIAITAGFSHTCAILANGQVTCWGDGSNGQLGYGNLNNIGDNETPAQNPVNGGIVPLPGGQTATAIAAGSSVTCAILANGQLTCWGAGSGGHLGYGNTNNIGDNETPAQNPVNNGIVPLPGNQTATAIAAGSGHTCAVLANGKVACWGLGSSGRLGYGNTNNIGDNETPAQNPANNGVVDLPGGQNAIALDVNGVHSCAVLASGSVICWGLGANGRLGFGDPTTIGDDETPAEHPDGDDRVLLPGNNTAVAISLGSSHTCALLTSGGPVCWGAGANGRLGYGNVNDIGDNESPSTNPVNGGIVPVPGTQTAASVTTGDNHTCALLATGQVTCWGAGVGGRLGYGNTNNIGDNETPARNPVNGGIVPLPSNQTATAISAGDNYTCALLANGQVTCWGTGAGGKLGYGNTNNIGDNETPAQNPVNGGIVPLPGNQTATAISAGGTHACALLANGQVTCWGTGNNGQLGYGNTNTIGDNETPAQNPANNGIVPLPGNHTAVAIAAGLAHSCALLASGQVTCWGSAGLGQLGYGNTNNIGDNETPAQNPVNGGILQLPGGRPAIAIAAGQTHTCAILDTGQLTCWGAGNNGRLGYGNTNTIGDNETPAQNPVNGGMVALPGNQTAVAVATGVAHTCAVLASGQLTCWGAGNVGRLGYASAADVGDNETPAQNPVNGGVLQLPLALSATSVSSGTLHTCAILATRQLSCWGSSALGQLGYGNTDIIGDDELPNANAVNDGFVPLPNPLRASDLVALTPARLVDTRPGFSTFDGQLQGGGTRPAGSTLTIPVRGRGGVPRNATSVVLSISAVSPAANGFLVAYPCDKPRPTAANLNYQAGVTVANTAIATLSAAGTACVFTNQAIHLVVDVNAATPPSSAIAGITPARLADTRAGQTTVDGLFNGQGIRAAGSTLTLTVAGRGPVPASARTVALNVSAVTPSANGFLTVFPCDQTRPTASSLNYSAGTTTANFVYATTAADGTICVFTNQTTHLVVDIVAVHATGLPAPSRHHPLPPSRLVDTRAGQTTADSRFNGIGQRAAGSTLVLPVAARYPATAARVASLNVTAVTPAANGFITIWPCDQPRPTAATFNYRAGITRSVGTLATISPQGTVCIFTNQATHLVVDVNGTTL